MSNHQSSSTLSSSSTFSSSFTSSSSTTRDGVREERSSGQRHAQSTQSGPDGTRTVTESQRLGEPAVRSERQTDASGREIVDGQNPRIADVSGDGRDEEQERRDREYEERMEEEYAKREGGA